MLLPILLLLHVAVVLPSSLLLSLVCMLLLPILLLMLHYKLGLQHRLGKDPSFATSFPVGQRIVLGHHACSFVGVEVSFFTLNVGNVEVAICIRALVARMIYIVATCEAIPNIIVPFDTGGVGGLLLRPLSP